MKSPFHPFFNILELPEGAAFSAFEWEIDGFDLLLRPQNGDVQTVWAYLGRRDVAQRLLQPRTLRTSRNKVVGAFNARRLWRMWPLEDGVNAFFRGEFGLLCAPDENRLVRFELPNEFKSALDAFEASGERIKSLFERLGGECESDFNAAKQWRLEHRKDWANLKFERGTPEELETVLRHLAHTLLDPAHSEFWEWRAHTSCHGQLEFPWIFLPFTFKPFAPEPLESLRRLMEKRFQAQLEPKNWRGYDRQGDPTNLRLPKLNFDVPSMHEQLEAGLWLRDWLRGQMSDAEIAALLETRQG